VRGDDRGFRVPGSSPAVLPMFFAGIACGAVVLAWLYNRSGRSLLVVALWHGAFNIASGSIGARGSIAAITTTLVMVQAVVLVALQLAGRRVLDPPAAGPGGAV